MSTATVTTKGQITIPRNVRERLGIHAGDRVEFIETEEGIFQIVAAARDVRSLKGSIPKPDRPVTIEEMKEAIAGMGGKV